mgnify:CR=1 FL=1
MTFGAFVEIVPGRDGLLHISEIDHHRVARTEDVLNVGDMVMVKVIGVDRDGKIKLSRKALLPEPEGGVPAGAGAGSGVASIASTAIAIVTAGAAAIEAGAARELPATAAHRTLERREWQGDLPLAVYRVGGE